MEDLDITKENCDICMLLDFYGQLLTEKSREITDLHYNEDMSLSEISQNCQITRQAVHDTIKRTVATLKEYETKLQLVDRFLQQQKLISEAISDIDSGNANRAREKLSNLTGML